MVTGKVLPRHDPLRTVNHRDQAERTSVQVLFTADDAQATEGCEADVPSRSSQYTAIRPPVKIAEEKSRRIS